MQLGQFQEVEYIVQFYDPDFGVDGSVQTHHHGNLEAAELQRSRLANRRPNIVVAVFRQVSNIERIEIVRPKH